MFKDSFSHYIVSMFRFILAILCWVLLLSSGYSKPRAIIHIGPSKTGSTTIQGAITHIRHELESAGWYPLSKTDGDVTHARPDVDHAFVNFKEKKPDKSTFFRDALAAGRNVIVSAEYLGSKDARDLAIYADVVRDFDTTVVMYYRDFLSRQLSYHYQVGKYDSFLDFLTSEDMAALPVNVGADGYFKRVPLWSRLGREEGEADNKVVLVDFNGAANSGKSFAEVFFCTATGIICGNPKLEQNVRSNPSHQSAHAHKVVQHMFAAYSHSRGCSVRAEEFDPEVPSIGFSPADEMHKQQQQQEQLHGDHKGHKKKREEGEVPDSIVPRTKRDLAHLVLYSQLLDGEVRRQFESLMVLGDVKANMEASAAHATLEEVDKYRMAMSPFWLGRFEEDMRRQVKERAERGEGTTECLDRAVVKVDGTTAPLGTTKSDAARSRRLR